MCKNESRLSHSPHSRNSGRTDEDYYLKIRKVRGWAELVLSVMALVCIEMMYRMHPSIWACSKCMDCL